MNLSIGTLESWHQLFFYSDPRIDVPFNRMLYYNIIFGCNMYIGSDHFTMQQYLYLNPNHSSIVFCSFQVGVILDLDSLVGRIGLSSLSLSLSDFYSVNTNYTTKLALHVRDSRGQVIDAAAAALSLLNDVEVDAIIGPQRSSEASFVIGLGDRAKVPIMSFSASSPALHSPNSYFLRATLSDSYQVDAIAAIVKHFQWSQIVLVYEDTHYGNGIIPYLSNAFQDINARVTYRSIIPLSATDDTLLQELYKMKTMQTRVFVVHLSSSLASRFFPRAKQAGMMVEGYAWMVTSELMDLLFSLEPMVIEAMQGVLGVKPLIPVSAKLRSTAARWKRKFLYENPDVLEADLGLYGLWAYDTMWALAMAAERVGFRKTSSLRSTSVSNSTNMFRNEMSETGPKLLEAISDVTFDGVGGKFHLVDGQLEPSSFQILNVVGRGEREVGIWTPKGILYNSSDKKLKSVIFPGETTVVPRGWEVPVSGKKLKVGIPVAPGFPEFVKVEEDPQTKALKVTGCFIDMFDAVMAALPYSVPYEYVPFGNPNGSSAGTYDDLAYQVYLQNYDAAVGDITITSTRSKYVDFTLPFSEGGVDIVVPITHDHQNDNWIFLRPLAKELWLTAIALFILTGVTLWILEHRFNNAYRGPPAQHAGMIFYFPLMSLVFAQRERIVSNLARLVVVVWLFVVLILNSTYTASLSARLTVQRLQPAFTDVKELTRKGYYVGCHKGSFVPDLLIKLGFDKTKIMVYAHPEDSHEALSKGSQNGGISAFFSVKSYTKLFLSKYCDKYTVVGPTYHTKGFAYVFPKGSPLVADVSRAVVKLTENDKLSRIEGEWMNTSACDGADATVASTTVSLQSFRALFGITAGITTTCLIVFLVNYLYKNRDFVERISSSSTTIWSKFCAICRHFDQRDPKSFRTKGDEESASPNPSLCIDDNHNPWSSSTVVPISSVEMDDIGETQQPIPSSPP